MEIFKVIPKYMVYLITIVLLFLFIDSFYIREKPFYFFGKEFGFVTSSLYLEKNNNRLITSYFDRKGVSLDKCLSISRRNI